MKESTIHRRRERLRKITGGLGLGGAYGATIERIKAQGGDRPRLAIAALMWICYAERPLMVDELCHALAIELSSTDLNPDNIPSITALVGCCQGLITVDKEASTVRLIHYTLQEYLSTTPYIFTRPHSAMAEICLTYLNFDQVKAIPSDYSPDILKLPFLKYSSLYWGVHAKRELSDHGRSLALQLLQECGNHISIKSLLEDLFLGLRGRVMDMLFSGLHWASFFGVVELVAVLIEIGPHDTDGRDFSGRTPLAWAAQNGHQEVVKILLKRGEVDPNKADRFATTPLHHAIFWGHEGVVKVLLGWEEVSPCQASELGRTPLSIAAECGHEGVVKMLIGRQEVNPHEPDDTGTTPFAYAAQRGHKEVVKMLLAHQEVDPDNPDTWDATLLWHAAACDEEIAKILLRREDADPNKVDHNGRTLLSYAASNGHEGVVRILLGHKEVNPNMPDKYGDTPLYHAASNRRVGIVKMLLERKDVNPDQPNRWGETPLMHAADFGLQEVVEILLRRKEVNPTSQIRTAQHRPCTQWRVSTRK